ncbi:MAG: hypothetical protein VKS61_14055 [Candidatus Sericytochromatia bacterium]|nr:hypothetical protein [Candidatus Sericytochromatia bacterium]
MRPLAVLLPALGLLAACGAPPTVGASLAYALIVNSGKADLTGHTLSPVLRDSPFGVGHAQAAGIRVEAVTLAEAPRAEPTPVVSDGAGFFRLKDLPDGEPVFLKARFSLDPPRVAYAFGRPRAPVTCVGLLEGVVPPRRVLSHPPADVELSLASTVLARAIARSDWLPESFDPYQTPDLLVRIEARLAVVLPELAAETGLTPAALIDAFLAQEALGDPRVGWVDGQDVVKRVIWDDPELARLVAELGQAWLNVTFTIQAVGDNRATYPGQRLSRHVARGSTRLVCSLPPDAPAYDGVSFWLNNEQVAQADRKGQTWQARIETGRWPDGGYVVTAQGRPAGGGAPATLTKAFLYLDNGRGLKGCPP